MWPSYLYPPEKVFLSSSVWPRREYTWTLNWKESLLICFENVQGIFYLHRYNRKRRMNTSIIVKYCFEDKSMIVYCKKLFLLPSVWPGTEYSWALIWKRSLLICFESYPGIPYFHTGSKQKMVNTLLMVNINYICKR